MDCMVSICFRVTSSPTGSLLVTSFLSFLGGKYSLDHWTNPNAHFEMDSRHAYSLSLTPIVA